MVASVKALKDNGMVSKARRQSQVEAQGTDTGTSGVGSADERIRGDLRRELAKLKEDYSKLKTDSEKEIEDLKKQVSEKDKMIKKFEMFIDLCNQRVMVQRELLNDGNEGGSAAVNSSV
ncbi:hypothetical protein MGG_11206 [Pyricularia oryzae 70-15]|uniref:Uncharacterized protein n=1 Tax=Pyricularia oryzae (strain 70-15 / ATCC MYA-4617 / FGSC 8958) TaxID=242507 RepID=G4MSI9_PYRO7|nr:uncharacterized protein MGG_11206 [Pyricularia oryzae 70-15]EHA54605.1 hypothetical protein MGG_11206 [Pyricularia oryzae 70-15]